MSKDSKKEEKLREKNARKASKLIDKALKLDDQAIGEIATNLTGYLIDKNYD